MDAEARFATTTVDLGLHVLHVLCSVGKLEKEEVDPESLCVPKTDTVHRSLSTGQ